MSRIKEAFFLLKGDSNIFPFSTKTWPPTWKNPVYAPGSFPGLITLFIFVIYSVMQSDGNSFFGDVVSYSFNKNSQNVDNILYQIYKNKYFRIIIVIILILYNNLRKCLLQHYKRTKTQFYEFLFFKYDFFFSITFEI